MPIIGSQKLGAEFPDTGGGERFLAAAFRSALHFTATPEVTKTAVTRFASKLRLTASPEMTFNPVTRLASKLHFTAHPYINGEPNILTSARFASKLKFEAIPMKKIAALSRFAAKFRFDAIPHFAPAPEYKLTVNLTILPAVETNPNIRVWQPRLLVNGAEVQIISWEAPEGESNVGRKLSVVLQRWIDKDLFTDTAVINFGLGKKVSGSWDADSFITLIANGTFQVSSHTVSGPPSETADRVTINLTGNLTTRLNTRPPGAVVVYDASRINQRPEFYQTQYDQLGNTYVTSLSSVVSLSLQKLINFVLVTKCGFSEVVTNLPDYPIIQNYFPLGDRWYDGIKKFLGIFNPIIYQDGDKIGIMDATLLQPDGFPDAEIVEVDRVQNLTISDDRSNKSVTAIRIQFINNVEDYDTISTVIDDPVTQPDGENTITIQRVRRTYSKQSAPFIVGRDELVSEVRSTTDANGNLIARSTERYTYTANNQQESRTQIIEGLYPDLANWVGKPTMQPPYLFDVICREVERFEHAAFPISSLDGSDQREYVSNRSASREGIILVNAADQHLGKPFRQEYQPGTRSGNITEDTTLSYGPIKSLLEICEPVPNTQLVNFTSIATDFLPVKPQVFTNYSQQRPGDVAAKQFTVNERTLIIRPDGTDQLQGIEDFHFGELPLDVSIPLAKRYVNSLLKVPRTIQATYIGYDDSLSPGQVRRLALRDGTIIGTFIILGRTPNGSADGTFMTLTCREV